MANDADSQPDDKGTTVSDSSDAYEYELTVVFPCLNEAETLAVCIQKAQQALEEGGIDGEVVVADNGSTDGSIEIAEQEGARVVHVDRRGYGAALIGGIEGARGKYILQADADDSYDLERIPLFYDKLEEGYDLVMGDRFEGGIKPNAMPFMHKYLGNPVLSFIGRLFFDSDVGDFHCGQRAYRRDKIEELDLRTTGMEFASEMIVKAELHDFEIAEVPVRLFPDGREEGEAHLDTWRDGWRHLRFLLMYSPRWLFVYPGLFLMMLGLGLGGWLFFSPPIEIGALTLNIHTFLYAALMVLVGFQAIWFGMFSKLFAVNAGLYPEQSRVDRMLGDFDLEAGLGAGALLTAAGLGFTIYALVYHYEWFQTLGYEETLRMIIPAFTAVALGSQIMLSSFFVSTLGLPRAESTS